MSTKVRGPIALVLTSLMLVLPILAACSIGSPTTTGSPGLAWGLPFRTGTSITLGCLGLHDDNIFADGSYSFTNQKPLGGVPSQTCPPPHEDDTTHANDASLDLLSTAVGVPVIPLAAGTVLVADESCHLVVVDHGSGTWVAYLHIDVQVTVGQQVTRDSVLGTTAAMHSSACEHSNAPHVHFAFLRGSGHSGTYVSMVGTVLCGYQVIQNSQYPIGALQQVAPPYQIVAPGDTFTVSDCSTSSGPSPDTPTSSTNGSQPTPALPPTPTVGPLDECVAIAGFTNADSASSVAAQFISQPVVPFPPSSLGYVERAYDDPSLGQQGMVFHFELIDVCTPETTPGAVHTFFAGQMRAAGWDQSSTFPYDGDFESSCGDPYCWLWGPYGGDVSTFASLESVSQEGPATVYKVRLGVDVPE